MKAWKLLALLLPCLAACGPIEVQVSGDVGVYVFNCLNPETELQAAICAEAVTDSIDCTSPQSEAEFAICDDLF